METKYIWLIATAWIVVGFGISTFRTFVWKRLVLRKTIKDFSEGSFKIDLLLILTFPWQMAAVIVNGIPSDVLPVIPNCMLMAFCNTGPLWPMEDITARAKIVESATKESLIYTRYTAIGIPVKVTRDKDDFFRGHFICSTLYGFLHIPAYIIGYAFFIFVFMFFAITSIDF